MKPLRALTAEDLRTTPVWRSLGGSDEQALVEPTSRATLSEMERETFLALTEFVLNNGQKHIGFCSPVDDSGLDYIQPVIVTRQGQLNLCSMNRQPMASSRSSGRGSAWPRGVFPIKYECLVPVDGRTVRGTISRVKSVGGVA
jgi:hypothetical protein